MTLTFSRADNYAKYEIGLLTIQATYLQNLIKIEAKKSSKTTTNRRAGYLADIVDDQKEAQYLSTVVWSYQWSNPVNQCYLNFLAVIRFKMSLQGKVNAWEHKHACSHIYIHACLPVDILICTDNTKGHKTCRQQQILFFVCLFFLSYIQFKICFFRYYSHRCWSNTPSELQR